MLDVEKYVGTPYRHNGRSIEEGLDCWGLVWCIYQELGIVIPAWDGKSRPEESWYKEDPLRYYRFLQKIGEPVDTQDLEPLDIVYFGLIDNGIVSHTGIVLDNNRFIHTIQRKNCRISKLGGYWFKKLRGARRILNKK